MQLKNIYITVTLVYTLPIYSIKMKVLPIKFTDEEYANLKAAAKQTHQPMSHVIKQHIRMVIAPAAQSAKQTKPSLIQWIEENAFKSDEQPQITSDNMDRFLYDRDDV